MFLKMAFNTLVTESRTTDVEGVGTYRYETDGKVYKWVYNNGAALKVGSLACHDVAQGATASTAISLPATANLTALAGVVASTAIAAGSYGWVQIAGLVDGVYMASAGTLTAGTMYIPTNNASTATALSAAAITSNFYAKALLMTVNGSTSTAVTSGTHTLRIINCL